ncbi:uncharacterized protein LOC126750569 [Anthonomus grandis grandis]|uniref:uncharacterized protein LOC126750569 n=1 Tax=Anthonomus grandis grandis TaxID=2921223 RepID=UPI0021667F1D|nr:uncharacterized protein LOC126750569 [Anthonomus grandis grandis]
MVKNTKKGLRETRAQYVLRLATQNNELAPKASEPNMLTNINTDNDAFDIQNNIIILSPTNVDFSSNNHPNNIIIEEVSQMDPGPDGHEYVKTILDDNDLQAELQSNGELLIINKYCEGQNCSLEQNVIIEEPLHTLLNLDVQKMDNIELSADNNIIMIEKNALQNFVEIPIEDSFEQRTNKNFSNTQEQEVTLDIDDDHFISNHSDQGSNYDPENETSGSSEYSSENGEEVRGESEVDRDNEDSAKKRTRKVLRYPETWKRSITKKRRNEGLEYVNVKNKLVKSRKVGLPCADKCRLKCRYRISQEQRKAIHKRFWKIGDIHRQRDYFLQCMDPITPKYRMYTPNSNRSKNYAYHFEIERERTRVCKLFYLSTLDISNKLIFTATKKKDASGILMPDMRGKHKNCGKKVTDAIKGEIRNHIKSFPTMPSHYCRAQTNKSYIDGSLNIASMYRLYKANCEELNKPFAKQNMYETIFNTEFNIAFYIPKKDQCMTCESLNNCTETEKELKQFITIILVSGQAQEPPIDH